MGGGAGGRQLLPKHFPRATPLTPSPGNSSLPPAPEASPSHLRVLLWPGVWKPASVPCCTASASCWLCDAREVASSFWVFPPPLNQGLDLIAFQLLHPANPLPTGLVSTCSPKGPIASFPSPFTAPPPPLPSFPPQSPSSPALPSPFLSQPCSHLPAVSSLPVN